MPKDRDDPTGYSLSRKFLGWLKRKPQKPPIPLPEPPPPPVPGADYTLYRIKKDTEVPDWAGISVVDGKYHEMQPRTCQEEFRSRAKNMKQAPQTVRVHLVYPPKHPKAGKSGPDCFDLPYEWQLYVKRINSPIGFQYLSKQGSGWVNKAPWPKVWSLLFRDTVIPVKRVDGKRAYIAAADLRRPPSGQTVWLNDFTVIAMDGRTVESPKGRVNLPIVAPLGCEMWIDLSELVPA